MMNSDYSIANGLTPTTTLASVPANIVTSASPIIAGQTPIMVVPRSTLTDTTTNFMPSFPPADITNLPMTSKFAANPRSLSALPTVTDTSTPVGAASTGGDMTKILASLVAAKTPKKDELTATASSGDTSSKILLDTIRELKEELLADKGDSSVKKGSLKKAKSPTPAKDKLVSSSPRSEAAVKA
ncbi:MAG: hypothetical protein H2174_09800 [Vampirovibrio sp.]|nr:hypothetical protein [Vampirovibrio sp.]